MSIAPAIVPHLGERLVPRILPLENGDTLTRAEFERRSNAMPHIKKAELIEGVVYMQASLRHDQHGSPHAQIMHWLGHYAYETPAIELSDNASVRLDLENMPQPDCSLFLPPFAGGTAKLGEDGYFEGAPDLVCEIAASSASLDMNQKLRVYRRNGVREYLIWRVLEGAFDWFVLEAGEYIPLVADQKGILKSRLFPGLWLDPATLLRGPRRKYMAALHQGLASLEHAAFVERLSKGVSGPSAT